MITINRSRREITPEPNYPSAWRVIRLPSRPREGPLFNELRSTDSGPRARGHQCDKRSQQSHLLAQLRFCVVIYVDKVSRYVFHQSSLSLKTDMGETQHIIRANLVLSMLLRTPIYSDVFRNPSSGGPNPMVPRPSLEAPCERHEAPFMAKVVDGWGWDAV